MAHSNASQSGVGLDWNGLPNEGLPEGVASIEVFASFNFSKSDQRARDTAGQPAHRAEALRNLQTPATGERILKVSAGNQRIPLGLGTLLSPLQKPDGPFRGGFDVTKELVDDVLRLACKWQTIKAEVGKLCDDPRRCDLSRHFLGAQLVLQTIRSFQLQDYKSRDIMTEAENFCKSVEPRWHEPPRTFIKLDINTVKKIDWLLKELSQSSNDSLRLTLFDHVRTAAFSADKHRPKWGSNNRSTYVLPCYMIVDLVTVLVSPGEEVCWPVYMYQGTCFFFDRQGSWQSTDGSRKGVHFEATVVDKSKEQDRLLAECILPRSRLVYETSPDAFEPSQANRQAGRNKGRGRPQPSTGTALDTDGVQVGPLKIKGSLPEGKQGDYVEVKKRTHYNFQAGPECEKKDFRTYMQALFSTCGKIYVGLDMNSTVDEIKSFTLDEFIGQKKKAYTWDLGRLLAGLDQLMQDIGEQMEQEGAYTLTVRKSDVHGGVEIGAEAMDENQNQHRYDIEAMRSIATEALQSQQIRT